MPVPVLVFDSVTKLPPEADGAVVIGGSHAAVYAAYMSARFGCRAAIHHDAGIGKNEAGVSGLAYADQLGMAMAAVASKIPSPFKSRCPSGSAERRTTASQATTTSTAPMTSISALLRQ